MDRTGTADAGTAAMTGGANSKILTRILAVVFVGLAFAGCAAMFAADRSLFAETSYSDLGR